MSYLKKEILRKSIHLSGIFLLPILYWNKNIFALILSSALFFYLFIEWFHKKKIKIPLLTTLIQACKRDYEKESLARGPILLAVSGIFLPYLFGTQAAAVGLSQIFVADVFATLLGMKFGKKKLPYSENKSWIGSFIFLIVALIVNLSFVPYPMAVILALLGAAIESLPIANWDNLTVPVSVSLLASLLTGPQFN